MIKHCDFKQYNGIFDNNECISTKWEDNADEQPILLIPLNEATYHTGVAIRQCNDTELRSMMYIIGCVWVEFIVTIFILSKKAQDYDGMKKYKGRVVTKSQIPDW